MSFPAPLSALPGHVPATFGTLAVHASALLLVAGLLMATVFYLRSWLRGRAAARAVVEEGTSLSCGPIVLRGVIEGLPARGPVVSVELEQVRVVARGNRMADGPVATVWREVGDRRVTARPFTLRLASGERIQVEPGATPELRAELELGEQISAGRRRRIAQLAPGQVVEAVGTLCWGLNPGQAGQAGYRDAGEGWVLQPRAPGPMVLSATPLAEHHRADARTHGRMALGLLAVLLFGHGLLLGDYHRLAHWGERVEAQARYVEVRGPRYRNPNRSRFVLRAEHGGARLSAPLPTAEYVRLRRHFAPLAGHAIWPVVGDQRVTLRMVRSRLGGETLIQVGEHPTVHVARIAVLWLLTLWALAPRRRSEWTASRPFVERL